MSTSKKGVELKKKFGTKPDFSVEDLEEFHNLTKEFNRNDREINKLTKKQEKLRERIIEIAKASHGIRGIVSRKNKFSLTVYTSETITWDRKKLKESLKNRYPSAVREKTVITVTVPELGAYKNEKAVEKAIKEALINLGIRKKHVSQFINKKVNINVNEEELDKIITDNKIKLPAKTKKSEVTWKVRTAPLKS